MSQAKDIPPPQKLKKLVAAQREKAKTPATKGSPRTTDVSGKTAAPPSKLGKGQRKKGNSTPTCTADKTATGTPHAPPPRAPLPRTPPPAERSLSHPPAPLPRTPPPAARSLSHPPALLPRTPLPAARSLSHPPAPLPNEHRKHRRY
ncbi:hypothetical protein NDU88_003124 [Pleurodeles waltl]|uniref:Uncharacterized protein n=1 Tax=Pleurodeles waltl TaxID=8319 RepID=A0AAV7W3V7_PLEWA|nr:hypothetical protein NDU88_003124 [Pleurodeles waltl]